MEQIVEFPARGGLQGFPQARVSTASLPDPRGDAFEAVLRTFPRPTKCGGTPPVGCESAR